ncbi:hypothetical protein Nepgr_009075 [Nepenthes gracilis]|uniref:PGG domain-containing protein n=1 Tax=Nepenthes gracilis TaxID=150966 RepID=A0AAD3S9U2_NEPGR|nr:hypothetical protein Nepgr_009075 [Nepenthes gracilis]
MKDVSGDCLNIGRLLQQAGALNSRRNVSSETTGAAGNMTTTIVGGSNLQEALDSGSVQAGSNTPGGFYQDTLISDATYPKSHFPGQSILANEDPRRYRHISIANATAFFISSCIFLLLLSGLPLKNKVCTGILMVAAWIAIVAVGYSFLVTISATAGFGSYEIYVVLSSIFFAYMAVIVIIFLGHIGRFLVKMVRRCWRKHRSSSSSTAAPVNHDYRFLTRIASIDVNAKNVFGLTALDLIEIRMKDVSGDCLNIGRLLQQAGALNSRRNVSSETTGAARNMTTTIVGGSNLQEALDRFLSKLEEWHKQQERNGRLESHRNAIMIAASQFAAAAFQAGSNTPGGFYQDTLISDATHTKSHFPGQSIIADSDHGVTS